MTQHHHLTPLMWNASGGNLQHDDAVLPLQNYRRHIKHPTTWNWMGVVKEDAELKQVNEHVTANGLYTYALKRALTTTRQKFLNRCSRPTMKRGLSKYGWFSRNSSSWTFLLKNNIRTSKIVNHWQRCRQISSCRQIFTWYIECSNRIKAVQIMEYWTLGTKVQLPAWL